MEIEVKLSEQEIRFIRGLFEQITINPTSNDALTIVGYIQSILHKITPRDTIMPASDTEIEK